MYATYSAWGGGENDTYFCFLYLCKPIEEKKIKRTFSAIRCSHPTYGDI